MGQCVNQVARPLQQRRAKGVKSFPSAVKNKILAEVIKELNKPGGGLKGALGIKSNKFHIQISIGVGSCAGTIILRSKGGRATLLQGHAARMIKGIVQDRSNKLRSGTYWISQEIDLAAPPKPQVSKPGLSLFSSGVVRHPLAVQVLGVNRPTTNLVLTSNPLYRAVIRLVGIVKKSLSHRSNGTVDLRRYKISIKSRGLGNPTVTFDELKGPGFPASKDTVQTKIKKLILSSNLIKGLIKSKKGSTFVIKYPLPKTAELAQK